VSVPGLISGRPAAWVKAPGRAVAALARVGRRLSRSSVLVSDAVIDGSLGERTHRACAERAAWLAENLCAIHGLQIERFGDLPRRPVVLVANHVGYFDPMVLLSLLPAMPIAKRELGEWPLLGRSLAPLGVALVRRGDPYDGARDPAAPTFALVGGVHGLERIGTQVILAYLTTLTSLLQWDGMLRAGLTRCRIAVLPMVNPVGIALQRRANGNGVDIMRNAPCVGGFATPLVGDHR